MLSINILFCKILCTRPRLGHRKGFAGGGAAIFKISIPLDPAIGSAMVVFFIFAKSFLRWICIVVPYFLRSRTQRCISFQHVRGVCVGFWREWIFFIYGRNFLKYVAWYRSGQVLEQVPCKFRASSVQVSPWTTSGRCPFFGVHSGIRRICIGCS